jgi:hypothetical protein
LLNTLSDVAQIESESTVQLPFRLAAQA